jgi:hypothetical protein
VSALIPVLPSPTGLDRAVSSPTHSYIYLCISMHGLFIMLKVEAVNSSEMLSVSSRLHGATS